MVEVAQQTDARRQQKRRNVALGVLLVALVGIIMAVTVIRLSEGSHREAAKRAAEAEAAGLTPADIPGGPETAAPVETQTGESPT